MASSLRKALGAVKDQTSIGLAKVSSTSAPDLDVAIVKATSHDDMAADEKYVLQILQLTSMSRAYANACVGALAKRLSKTHNWIVAFKVLTLIHRLLRDENAFFKDEFFNMARRILNLSNFTDETHSNAWDYSTFVRTFAAYLDARMDCFLFDGEPRGSIRTRDDPYTFKDDSETSYRSRLSDDEVSAPKRKENPSIKDTDPLLLLDKIPRLQQILERVLACRPTGAAKHHRLIQISLYALVKESFQIYEALVDGISILLDMYSNVKQEDCAKILEIYVRSGKQSDGLSSFYEVAKAIGVCRDSEYPKVEKLSEDIIDKLEKHLRGELSSSSCLERPKAPEDLRRNIKETKPVAEAEVDYESYESIYGMKALPAPPTDQSLPNPSGPVGKPMNTPIASSQSKTTVHPTEGLPNTTESDLLNLNKEGYSAEEKENKLALALFSTTAPSSKWETFDSNEQEASEKNPTWQASSDTGASANDKHTGWEVALVSEASNFTKFEGSLAGNFDKLLLDSMYDHHWNKVGPPSGSASSVALPGRPSEYLALPAPAPTGDGDPFVASTVVPPPSYVQMADLKEKQLLLLQEQQLWQQYQINGMQGHMNLYRPPYAATAFAPQYAFGLGMGASAQGR